MNNFEQPHPSSLAGMLGQSSLSADEIAELRHKAWRQQGLLIVRPSDPRLSRGEAALVRDIAERLYGGDQP